MGVPPMLATQKYKTSSMDDFPTLYVSNMGGTPMPRLSSRMETFVNALEPILIYVGVDLRCSDVAVAEEFLHDAEVGAAAEEVGGEAMAERVGGNALEQAAAAAVFLHQHPQADPLHRLAAAGEEQKFQRPALQFRAALFEIARNRLSCGLAERNDALLHSFSQHPHATDLQIGVANFYLAQFGGSQAACVKKLQNRDVAEIESGVGIGG